MRIIALFTILIRTFAVKSSRALQEIYIPDSEENSEDEFVEKDDDEDNIDVKKVPVVYLFDIIIYLISVCKKSSW